jgi:protein-S-isoprenylcysteine O-methyltransferase Ste14
MPQPQDVAMTVLAMTLIGFFVAAKSFRSGRMTAWQFALLACSGICTLAQVAGFWLLGVTWIGAMTVCALCSAAVWLYVSAQLTHSGPKRPAFAFREKLPVSFESSGPYRVVRHPIYAAYLLAWIAGPVATLQPLLILPILLVGLLFYTAARQEERAFSQTEYSTAYREYQSKTGMFWPRVF